MRERNPTNQGVVADRSRTAPRHRLAEGPEYSNDPTRYLDTYLLRDVAVREIGRWGADRPLFMVVSFHGPHFPAFFDAADADRFAVAALKAYSGGCVQVGRRGK